MSFLAEAPMTALLQKIPTSLELSTPNEMEIATHHPNEPEDQIRKNCTTQKTTPPTTEQSWTVVKKTKKAKTQRKDYA